MTTEQGAPEAGVWKTVPVEPTREMRDAVWNRLVSRGLKHFVIGDILAIWETSLAASPSPPPVGVGEQAEAITKIKLLADAARLRGEKYIPVSTWDLTKWAEALSAPPVGGEVVKMEALPDDIRAQGWSVAVHNDYRLNGEPHTFWLFTNGDRAVKGEGRTDAEALNQVRSALVSSSPSLLEEPGEALRKAAKPFVEFSELSGFDRMPADMPITAGSRMAARQLTAGDLRSLIEVLAKLGVSS